MRIISFLILAILSAVSVLRKKKNKSGSISVQIILKSGGKYKVVKTIGSGRTEQEIEKLYYLCKQEIEHLSIT